MIVKILSIHTSDSNNHFNCSFPREHYFCVDVLDCIPELFSTRYKFIKVHIEYFILWHIHSALPKSVSVKRAQRARCSIVIIFNKGRDEGHLSIQHYTRGAYSRKHHSASFLWCASNYKYPQLVNSDWKETLATAHILLSLVRDINSSDKAVKHFDAF